MSALHLSPDCGPHCGQTTADRGHCPCQLCHDDGLTARARSSSWAAPIPARRRRARMWRLHATRPRTD